jgi:hypothetical protein
LRVTGLLTTLANAFRNRLTGGASAYRATGAAGVPGGEDVEQLTVDAWMFERRHESSSSCASARSVRTTRSARCVPRWSRTVAAARGRTYREDILLDYNGIADPEFRRFRATDRQR